MTRAPQRSACASWRWAGACVPLFLVACTITEPITEPISEEDYYVRNERSETVQVEATHLFTDEPVMLVNDVVPPGETAHVHHVVEGSGGHTFPSNFFSSFTVRAGDEVLYDEVDDADWSYESGLGLVLTISP